MSARHPPFHPPAHNRVTSWMVKPVVGCGGTAVNVRLARRSKRWLAWCLLLVVAMQAAVCSSLGAANDAARPAKPNIVIVLSDDQDHMLGGSSDGPLPRSGPALRAAGLTAANWFVHTPVCCPSRSEIITGRLLHNLAWDAAAANKWDTGGKGQPDVCT